MISKDSIIQIEQIDRGYQNTDSRVRYKKIGEQSIVSMSNKDNSIQVGQDDRRQQIIDKVDWYKIV